MSDVLTFEQTMKLMERGVIEAYSTHLCLNKFSIISLVLFYNE